MTRQEQKWIFGSIGLAIILGLVMHYQQARDPSDPSNTISTSFSQNARDLADSNTSNPGATGRNSSTPTATGPNSNFGYTEKEAGYLREKGISPSEMRAVEQVCGAACR